MGEEQQLLADSLAVSGFQQLRASVKAASLLPKPAFILDLIQLCRKSMISGLAEKSDVLVVHDQKVHEREVRSV